MKKKILIISYGYPPLNDAGAQRPYAIAKNLESSKYSIKVITCLNPSTVLGLNKDFDPSLEGVSLIKIKSLIGGDTNSLKLDKTKKRNFTATIKGFILNVGQKLVFPDKGAFWFPKVKAYLKHNSELVRETDVVISTSPGITNHRIAQFIKRKNPNIHWIADFRDFNYVENWDNKTGIKAFLHKKLESSIVREATNLTFVTQIMQKEYQKFYPQYKDKIYCVFNGFDKGDYPALVEPLGETDKLSFFYAGSFYNGLRSPLPLMQLLDKAFEDHLLTKETVQIQIAGSLDKDIKSAMKKYKSFHCVNFLGSIPRAEVLKYMGKSTFLWLIVANIKSHYQTIPIKLYEYIAARRPIVNFAPIVSESSQIIQEMQLGYNFNTLDFNIEETYQIFKDLISKYKEGNYSEPMPNENLDFFMWENQIRIIENLI